MPFLVGKAGNIDGIIQLFFGCDIDTLDADAVLSRPGGFGKLCRAIALTERRGMEMVKQFLASSLVSSDPHLVKILKVVERDEPSHWQPYEEWILRHDGGRTQLRERIADSLAHGAVLAMFPFLLLNPRLPRCTEWPEDRVAAAGRVTAPPDVRAVAG
jgi:hypothetical protein